MGENTTRFVVQGEIPSLPADAVKEVLSNVEVGRLVLHTVLQKLNMQPDDPSLRSWVDFNIDVDNATMQADVYIWHESAASG